MNNNDEKYTKFNLTKEMLSAGQVLRSFDKAHFQDWAGPILDAFKKDPSRQVIFTGEGSSRIFPAKRTLAQNAREGFPLRLATEGATQALEQDLSKAIVVGASNSGRTRELIRLYKKLDQQGLSRKFGITANSPSLLDEVSAKTLALRCGPEKAVAASKSVVDQALSVHALYVSLRGGDLSAFAEAAARAGDIVEAVLRTPVDPRISDAIAKSRMIHFVGRNDGAAEELSLKAMEITRKKSSFLEGTFALHGIEEVIESDEVLVLVRPFTDEDEKYSSIYEKGVGAKVYAISTSDGPTSFAGLAVPAYPDFQEYIDLAAGWNLLIEAGLAAGVDLDKPRRARKIGNEYTGG